MADPVKIAGWPRGINNLAPDFALPEGSLRHAVNVDLLPGGRIRRRTGATLRLAGSGMHSLWSNGSIALFVEDGALKRLLPDMTAVTLRTGCGNNRMHFEDSNGDIHYTNNTVSGKVVSGQSRPWGVEACPTAPDLAATAGQLSAGTYQAVCTFVNADGEEGGCGRSSRITLSDVGGIRVTLPVATSSEVDRVRVYLTDANGDTLYQVSEQPIATAQITIDSPPPFGRVLRTQFMVQTMPGEGLAHYRGRFYLWQGPILWYTEPLQTGLVKPGENFLPFGAPITLVAAVDDGLYVVAGNETYFLSGADPKQFMPRVVLPVGAAKHSLARDPKNPDRVTWYSDRGVVLAGNGGQIALTQDGKVMPPAFARGASVYRESNGVAQIVAAVAGEKGQSQLAATDYMEAEIIRAKGRV